MWLHNFFSAGRDSPLSSRERVASIVGQSCFCCSAMAQIFQKDPRNAGLFIGGQRLSGADIRDQNVLAVQSIANVVKSSLGPVGLDKYVSTR